MIIKILKNLYIVDTESMLRNLDIYDYIDVRPVFDGDKVDWNCVPNLLNYVLRLSLSGKNVALFSKYGMEKAPFISVIILVKYYSLKVDKAYEIVKSGNPDICVSEKWLNELRRKREDGIL